MNEQLQLRISEYLKQHGFKKRYQKILTVLGAIVVFLTTYALIMPAVTVESETYCGIEEHEHTDECYDTVLVCGLEETEGHTHSEECWGEEEYLSCGMEECEGHAHTEACWGEESYLVCGTEECEGHAHTDVCWGEESYLVCEQQEGEDHTHGDECYATRPVLICGLEECEPHEHTDACYATRPVLICGLEECEPHEHTDACYATREALNCGKEECEPHEHTDECYEKELVCELEEHVHTLQCFSNPDADVETAADWEKAFEDVELTDNWAEDVLTIAETQLGYTESKDNYKVLEDGETMKGYTRYGQWNYDPYGDWCAMFCSFCMNYAEIDREVMPFDGNCQHWIDTLSDEDFELYHAVDSDYMPKPGDLIFFNHDEDEDADHVGFVYELIEATEEEPAQIRTIEGNHYDSAARVDCVNYVKYDLDDETILGYGEMPEKPEEESVRELPMKEMTITAQASDGAEVVINGLLPESAEATIEAVTLSEDELIAYFGKAKAAAMTGFVAYDIKIMVDGEEWQPDGSVSVVVKQPDITVEEGESLAVAHVDSETEEVSDVSAVIDESGEVSFEADGFSIYIFYKFTVDFHFGETTFSINGRSEILLSELFEELGIECNAADAVSVTFSDETLLTVEQVEGDWLLTSLEAFDTNETLTVEFADGETLIIDVTDAQGDTYLQKITKASDLVANAQYLIVRETTNAKYALTYTSNTAHSTSVTITAEDDLFVSTSVPDNIKWTLTSNNGLRSASNTNDYLNLGGSNFFNTTDRKMVFTYNNGTFTIKRDGGNYLRYNSSAFSADASNSTGFVIYKIVDAPTPPATTTYWTPVSEIDDTSANYIIVNNTSGWAIGVDPDDDAKRALEDPQMTLCPGSNNVYSTTLGSEYWWKFSATGNSSKQMNVKYSNYGIQLAAQNDTPIGTATTNTLAYSTSNGYWTIRRSNNNYYLRYNQNNNTIYSSTDTNNTERRRTIIYKQVDEPTLPESYWQRVSSLDQINANDTYLIVSAEGNYALKAGNDTDSSVTGEHVELVPVKGNPGYYTISNVKNSMAWHFGRAVGSSGGSTTIQGTNGVYLVQNSDESMFHNDSAEERLSYDSTTGTWKIRAGSGRSANNYYVNADGTTGKFTSTISSGNASNMLILKLVDTTLVIPDDVTSGSGSDIEDGDEKVRPTYDDYIEPSGAKSGSGFYSNADDVTMSYASDPATSDIERKFTGTSTDISLSVISGTNGMTDEGYGNLFDGSTNTKYCVNPENGKVTVTFKANDPRFVSGYSLTTADDNATTTKGRLPDGWTIYGSQSRNGSWVVLDQVTDTGMEAKNYTEYTYTMSNPGTYEYFKIEFDTDHMIQFSELKFSETPASNDGKVLTDKSVVYGDDDYNAFSSYGEDTFGVTLSALGQDYQLKEVDQIKIPVDVVFVLDVSGSMKNKAGEVTRREAVVDAVNSAMKTIMDDNAQNRAGVVLYSSGGSTLLPLDHYSPGDADEYLTHSDSKIFTANNLEDGEGHPISQTNGESDEFKQGNGTYTQYGIALGAKLLEDNNNTTYTAILNKNTDYEKSVTVNRQPVIILLSDGDPTHCTSNYTDVLSGPHYGSGSYPSTSNNKGIQGHYTILSANYYKRMVGIHYDTPALFYSVGMGINASGIEDLSGGSATGDHYKRAVLNPTPGNITDLHDRTNAKNYDTTANQLYQLLTNSYQGNSVGVLSTSSYSQLGTTNKNVPVLQNPYSSYSYADDAYFGNIDTEKLQEIFDGIIESSLNVKSYGYMLYQGSSVDVSDTIGDGMEIKGTPVLRYNGQNYSLTQKSDENGVVTYVCNSTSSTTDGSAPNGGQRTADLREIVITVTTADGVQTVEMHIPETLVPSYTPDISADWYYEQLPVRLIYQVGLTDAAKTEVQSLNPGESRTYYTNAWGNDTSAKSTQQPHEDNPYYNNVTYDNGTSRTKQYQDYSVNKTENTTGTATTSAMAVETVSSGRTAQVDVALGNNGKLVFTRSSPDRPPDHDKVIDAFRDGADNPDTDLDDKARRDEVSDIEDLYRLYLNVGPERAYDDLDVLFIFDASTSMCGDFSSDRGNGSNGFDAQDIMGQQPGHTNWRAWALDTLLNGEVAGLTHPDKDATDWNHGGSGNNAAVHQTTLYSNGLLSKIAALNPKNRIAVASFYKDATELMNWTDAGNVKAVTYSNQHGTNYVAGLQQAKKFIDSANDNNQKIMIFLSDGRPTYHYTDLYAGPSTLAGDGSETDNEASIASNAINQFKELYADKIRSGELSIYTIGVGSWDTALLDQLSTNGKSFNSTNFADILNELDNKITRGAGHFTNLQITDTLSKYVDFYKDDLDLVVQKIPDDSTTGVGEPLFSNGHFENGTFVGTKTELGETCIDTVTVDPETKTVTVKFLEDYEEEGGYKYSLSFNVKTTQIAYEEYAANLIAGKEGYSDEEHPLIKGDPDTDYTYTDPWNETSSRKPGWHSNQTAVLEYDQTHAGGPTKHHTVPYDDPVIQVSTKSITIRKVNDAGQTITGSSAKFEVYGKYENGVLSEQIGGTYTTRDGEVEVSGLSPGKTYYLVETKAPDGYNVLPEPEEFAVNGAGKIGKIADGEFHEYTQEYTRQIGDTYLHCKADSGGYVLCVRNSTGYTLPETGGAGTARIYSIGCLMMAGACLIMIRSLRKREGRAD